MNSVLNGSVKVISLNPVAWYSPSSFPTISTDAVIVDGDGELLLINPGWGFKVISVQQVRRIVTARIAENEELYAIEVEQYEAQDRE